MNVCTQIIPNQKYANYNHINNHQYYSNYRNEDFQLKVILGAKMRMMCKKKEKMTIKYKESWGSLVNAKLHKILNSNYSLSLISSNLPLFPCLDNSLFHLTSAKDCYKDLLPINIQYYRLHKQLHSNIYYVGIRSFYICCFAIELNMISSLLSMTAVSLIDLIYQEPLKWFYPQNYDFMKPIRSKISKIEQKIWQSFNTEGTFTLEKNDSKKALIIQRFRLRCIDNYIAFVSAIKVLKDLQKRGIVTKFFTKIAKMREPQLVFTEDKYLEDVPPRPNQPF
ncbi:UNKNOWN [Stylonychia lemnae]|uniref:Uncharacterized protein n=1 Tax=Stylonychia lemnae TaxID=5949 RepID=A0A078AFH1_STYLE|nr:UNKNOWN [Stylonychia lemnae]|eukprot:CDW80935.1 UNKNOWN [Stylonychia lemnae]